MYLHTILKGNVGLCVSPQWKEDGVISIRLKIGNGQRVTLYTSI